jgi:hypothetical protein
MNYTELCGWGEAGYDSSKKFCRYESVWVGERLSWSLWVGDILALSLRLSVHDQCKPSAAINSFKNTKPNEHLRSTEILYFKRIWTCQENRRTVPIATEQLHSATAISAPSRIAIPFQRASQESASQKIKHELKSAALTVWPEHRERCFSGVPQPSQVQTQEETD